jgi:hypothetical protein
MRGGFVMKWIVQYWYLILAGLAAVVFYFGYKTKSDLGETTVAHGEEQEGEKTRKSDHSCCH